MISMDKRIKAQIIAHGLMAGRGSIWMDGDAWRVSGYATSGTQCEVYMVKKSDFRKRKNRNEARLNRDEFLEVWRRAYEKPEKESDNAQL